MRERTARHSDIGPDHEPNDVARWSTELRRGNISVFEQTYLTYYERLWRVAFAFLHARDDAEDVVQTVFVRLWDVRENLPAITSLESYLYGAVRNECLRVLKHQRVVDRTAQHASSPEFLAPGMATSSAPIDARVEQDEIVRLLDQAIAALPERRRLALTLRWSEGLSYPRIAELMGISVENVYVLIARARDEIRAKLKGRYP